VTPRAAILALFALASCEQSRTELIVRVDSQLPWGPGQAVQSVVLEIRREGPSGPLRSLRTTVVGTATGQRPLPFTVGVTPADDSDAPVWFRLLGCSSSVGCTPADAVARAEAAERFVPGLTRDVALALGVADASVDGGNDAGELPDVAAAEGGVDVSCQGSACGPGERCESGACVAFDAGVDSTGGDDVAIPVDACSDAGRYQVCGERCVDTQTDPQNCTLCGLSCGLTGQRCEGGRCYPADSGFTADACPEGLQYRVCRGVCVDVTSDPWNCGLCNSGCGGGPNICADGRCVPPDAGR